VSAPRPAAGARPAPPSPPAVSTSATAAARPSPTPAAGAPYRDALLAEIKAAKPMLYNLAVAQAFRIDADSSGVTFVFQPNQKVPKKQCDEARGWVQELVEKVTGQTLLVHIVFTEAAAPESSLPPPAAATAAPVGGDRKDAALEHETVRHLLDMFPVEKTTVQEE
jgi:hypothetical protein